MTLHELRSNKNLMLAIGKSEEVRIVLAVLTDEYIKFGYMGSTTSLTEAGKIETLGQLQGFNKAIATVKQCGEPPAPALREIQSTYGAVEPSAKGKKK